eukprot:2050397-Heterocapsa_arctica.AAC.1
MPVSYPQHTSGVIAGFIPRFHTPSIPLVSYLVSYRFHTGFIYVSYLVSIPRTIPAVSCWFHTSGFIPGFIPLVSYRFHGVHLRAA